MLRQLGGETSGSTGVRLAVAAPSPPDRSSGPSDKALVLGATAVSPAMANYDRCYEEPYAKGCPGNFDVTQEPFYVAPSKRAQHEMHRAPRHHG